MELSDLYSPGTKLAEVDPLFRGMRLHHWRILKISEQGEELRKAEAKKDPSEAPLSQKRLWNPRDDYGWRSL